MAPIDFSDRLFLKFALVLCTYDRRGDWTRDRRRWAFFRARYGYAYIDHIANPPIGGGDGQAWINSLGMALHSLDQMSRKLEVRFQSPAMSAGHAILSWAAVAGGDEASRGGGCPRWLRLPAANPRLGAGQTSEHRIELERNLGQMLAHVPRPFMFPVIAGGSALGGH